MHPRNSSNDMDVQIDQSPLVSSQPMSTSFQSPLSSCQWTSVPNESISTSSQSPSTSSQSTTRRRYHRAAASKCGNSQLLNKSKLTKASRSWKERKQTVETIGKLKQLVPTVPKDEQVSRMELLQHVIDYIFELQRQLNDPLIIAEDREL